MSVITKQSHGLAKKEGILVGRRSNFAWFRAGFHLIPLGPVLSRTYHLPSMKLYRKLNVWQSRFENVSSERPESPVSHRCHRRHHDDDHDPAACGKSRHRASPALWVATIRMMTVVMMVMVMVMMMALAMTTTTMTMRGRRRTRKAVTCGAFRFYLVRSSHGAHLGRLRAVWGSRGAVWEAPWGSLGPFSGFLGRLEALWGRLGVLLAVWGVSWGRLAPARGPLRPSWLPPEALLASLRLFWGRPGPSMSPLGPS